ncbi:MAG: permease prefix domain 1-containing protein [Gulosibacter sp.]|uniref:permease prefix domain 1-containing protein n=1 Tax=Gulosibacter sp. TaxID=2817531 RepID=UPI003F91C7FE
MDAIKSYIDHMFRGLPKTGEVTKAQRELQQMCEDRYNELRADGVSEHEAVGRVITQFGDLDELADDLGIRSELDGIAGLGVEALDVSREEAERFLRTRKRAARLIAGGIFVIMLGVSNMILFSEIASEDEELNPISLVLFFLAAAIAVGMFIVSGMSLGRFDRYERHQLRLDAAAYQHYRDVREAEQGRYTASIVAGVLVMILAFGMAATGGILSDQGAGDGTMWLVGPMPLIISIGVGILVMAGMRRGSLNQLTLEGEYDPEVRKDNELIGKIAGPYWMLAVLVFLAWSFIGDAWERSWIMWPIAGVLFGLIAVTIQGFVSDRDKKGVGR